MFQSFSTSKKPLLFLVLTCLATCSCSRRPRTVRVGIRNAPPYLIVDAKGPNGVVYSVMQEAARRRNIAVQWILAPEGPDLSLSAGKIDVWPVLAYSGKLQSPWHLSDPWMLKDFCLLSSARKPINSVGESAGLRIAHVFRPVTQDVVKRTLPSLTPVLSDTAAEAFQALCAGAADGAFLDLKVTQSMLLLRPPGCETTQLHSIVVPSATLPLSIASNRKAAAIADELRSGIAEMESDGSLEAIYAKWQLPSPYDGKTLHSLAKARRLGFTLLWGIGVLAAVLLPIGFFVSRLRRANHLARSHMSVRRQFITNMSQEFRAPLNGVIGMTGLLLSSELAGEQRIYGETARECAYSLLDMLNNLLDYSRMEEGSLVLDNRDFELHGLVEDVMEHYATPARAQGLEISCVIAPNVPQIVTGDPVRLRQVLANLVGNAIKFTTVGEVIINVRHVASTRGSVVLHFEVTDTGAGIHPADRPSLFECFAHPGNPGSRTRQGTGLGLAICRRIVDAAGGQIEFTSVPGKGSTFWVLMKFGQTQAKLPAKHSAPLHGKRALLIAASPSIRRSVRDQLTYLGVSLATSAAPRAGEVMRTAEQDGRAFQFLILDDVAADPLEFARSLALAQCAHPPLLLLLSGLQCSLWPPQSTESGIAAILPKPVRQSHLEQTLAAILQKRSSLTLTSAN